MVRVLRQEGQKVEFLGGKVLLLAVNPYTAGRLVNLKAPDLNDLILQASLSDQPLIAGQMGLHPGHHLTGAERLGDIVVRAQTQAPDLVDVILLRRNNDHRRIPGAADLLADLKAVGARQHQVQENQVKVLRQAPLQSPVAVILSLHLKTGKLQIILLQLRDTDFILNDQYSAHLFLPPDTSSVQNACRFPRLPCWWPRCGRRGPR